MPKEDTLPSYSRGNLILGLKPRVWCESRFGFVGIEIDDKTLIPGLAFASSRAKPLAVSHMHHSISENAENDKSNSLY
ncbi:RNA-binding protein, partial [Prunus dulcis]